MNLLDEIKINSGVSALNEDTMLIEGVVFFKESKKIKKTIAKLSKRAGASEEVSRLIKELTALALKFEAVESAYKQKGADKKALKAAHSKLMLENTKLFAMLREPKMKTALKVAGVAGLVAVLLGGITLGAAHLSDNPAFHEAGKSFFAGMKSFFEKAFGSAKSGIEKAGDKIGSAVEAGKETFANNQAAAKLATQKEGALQMDAFRKQNATVFDGRSTLQKFSDTTFKKVDGINTGVADFFKDSKKTISGLFDKAPIDFTKGKY